MPALVDCGDLSLSRAVPLILLGLEQEPFNRAFG